MSQSKAQLTNPFGTVNITDGVNVSGVITATTLIGDGTALTGIALTGNINTSGIITASEFYGYGGGLDNVGLGTEDSINTTGIITAGQFYGDGSLLTNIGGVFAPLTFAPSNGSTDVGITTNITILFNKSIQAGGGTITLRTDSASGTIEESFDVTSSDRLTFSAGTLTIDPTAPLSGLTTYYTVLPAGTVKDAYGLDGNTLIDDYSFTTQQLNFELYAFGLGEYGKLGQNDLVNRSSPTQIPGTEWKEVGFGYYNTLALKTDGTAWTWGLNANGQLGQNTTTNISSPVQIPGTQWSNLGYSSSSAFATKTDGTLWSWGINNIGGLGHNDAIPYSSPRQIPGTQWDLGEDKLSGGDYTGPQVSGAIKNDGTLWMWGINSVGAVGDGTVTPRSSPVQLPGTQWNTIHTGHTVISTKTDGTLWTWGDNSQGQLGQNNITQYYSPIQVPGTQWNKASTASFMTLATKTDGTLWVWGRNDAGKLGLNDAINRSSPTQLPGTQWDKISAAYYNTYATKTDGTLWAWGQTAYGATGNNVSTSGYASSPIQIPGTQWSGVMKDGARVYSAFAIKQVAP